MYVHKTDAYQRGLNNGIKLDWMFYPKTRKQMMDNFLFANFILLQQFGWDGYKKRRIYIQKEVCGINSRSRIYVKY